MGGLLYLLIFAPALFSADPTSVDLTATNTLSANYHEILLNNQILNGFILGSTSILMIYNISVFIFNKKIRHLNITAILIIQILLTLSLSDAFGYWPYISSHSFWHFFSFPILLIFTLSQLIILDTSNGKKRNKLIKRITVNHLIVCAISGIVLLITDRILIRNIIFLLLTPIVLFPIILNIKHAIRYKYPPALVISIGITLLNIPILLAWPLFHFPLDGMLNILIIFYVLSIPFTGYIISLSLNSDDHNQVFLQFTGKQNTSMRSTYRQAQSELLAQLSQEIRSPMNGILGTTNLLLDSNLSTKQKDQLKTIARSSNELLAMIHEVLDISRLQSNQIELHFVQFELNAIIDECIAAFAEEAKFRNIDLVTFIQPQVPRLANGDPIRLRQVILSLLKNAFSRSSNAEIIFTVTMQNEKKLSISIQSYGEELSDDHKQLLNQLPAYIKTSIEQHSLTNRMGLLIAHHLASLMNGTLNHHESEQSNTLTLNIPLEFIQTTFSEYAMHNLLNDQSVLIVEHNLICQSILLQQCQEWGMNTYQARTNLEAMALLRSQSHSNEKINVIIITHDLPHIDGIELAIRIQEDHQLAQDCILIMLSNSSSPNNITARNSGINYVLLKPITSYTLKATLADAFSTQQSFKQSELKELPLRENMRILVVEDNAISAKVIGGLLSKLNITSDHASDGESALDMMKSKPYDLVLMDCQMPVLDGFKTAQLWRTYEQKHQLKYLPIIALTAHVLDEYKEQATSSGMDGHLSKPIDFSELRSLIASYSH